MISLRNSIILRDYNHIDLLYIYINLYILRFFNLEAKNLILYYVKTMNIYIQTFEVKNLCIIYSVHVYIYVYVHNM